MSEYVPDESIVREFYVEAAYALGTDPSEGVREFDRLIARIKAEAWDEGNRTAFEKHCDKKDECWDETDDNPHREGGGTVSAWGEKAEDHAVAHHTYEYLTSDENAYYTSGFVRGARWQREALLSDEAVERAAHGIHASHDRGGWEHEPAEVLDEYRDMARVALTAAIGGDDE